MTPTDEAQSPSVYALGLCASSVSGDLNQKYRSFYSRTRPHIDVRRRPPIDEGTWGHAHLIDTISRQLKPVEWVVIRGGHNYPYWFPIPAIDADNGLIH